MRTYLVTGGAGFIGSNYIHLKRDIADICHDLFLLKLINQFCTDFRVRKNNIIHMAVMGNSVRNDWAY